MISLQVFRALDLFALAIGVFQRILAQQNRAQEREGEPYEVKNQTFPPIPRTPVARKAPTFEEKKTM
jgi:hypothetical protein